MTTLVPKPEASAKGGSNIQYRCTSLDTSFDNDLLLTFYALGHNRKMKQASLLLPSNETLIFQETGGREIFLQPLLLISC